MSTSAQLPFRNIAQEPGKFSQDSVLSLKEAAASLGTNTRAVRTLLEAGVLHNLTYKVISELSQKTVLVPSEVGQPVLRTGIESYDEELNRAVGYSSSMSDTDVVEANCRWWRADPNKIVEARFLPISVAGLVVALLDIAGVEESKRTEYVNDKGRSLTEVRHSFKATLVARWDSEYGITSYAKDDDSEEAVQAMVGHFQRSTSGGPIAYL